MDIYNLDNPRLKSRDKEYKKVHQWITKFYPRPRGCERCKTKKAVKYDWANRSGKYLWERSDWLNLCKSCHHMYDDKSSWMKPNAN